MFILLICMHVTAGPSAPPSRAVFYWALRTTHLRPSYVPSLRPSSQLYTRKRTGLGKLSLYLTHLTPAPNWANYDLVPALTGMWRNWLPLWLAEMRTINLEATGTTMSGHMHITQCTLVFGTSGVGQIKRERKGMKIWLSPSCTGFPCKAARHPFIKVSFLL